MVRALSLALLPALLTGCHTDDEVGAAAPVAADRDAAPASTEKADKVDICHYTGTGGYHVINVSTSAVSAHFSNHGDHYAGTYYLDVDGDGVGDSAETAECLGDGYAVEGGDCDDGDETANPYADEVCGDGVDNDCDGDVDEDCTKTVEVDIAGDNGVWAWLDGVPLTLSSNTPDWGVARTASMDLDQGQTYALAFYVEDWGGLGYFLGSVRVDGVPYAVTGDGDFAVLGEVLTSSVSDTARIAGWTSVPSAATDSPNLLIDPGTTWGDWMLPGFDDSSWAGDTNACTYPTSWNTTTFAASRSTFVDLAADGAAFVFPDYGYYAAGWCYSPGQNASVYRIEITL